MSTPFIWQFQFELEETVDWAHWIKGVPSEVTVEPGNFEQRFFWPEGKSIILTGLDNKALSLANYKIEIRWDHYLLLDGKLNIKIRKNKLHHKPLLADEEGVLLFGPKTKYKLKSEQAQILALIGLDDTLQTMIGVNEFIDFIKKQLPVASVWKETLRFEPFKNKTLYFELSRVLINKQLFYSLAIESTQKKWVQALGGKLGLNALGSQSYVQFLETIT